MHSVQWSKIGVRSKTREVDLSKLARSQIDDWMKCYRLFLKRNGESKSRRRELSKNLLKQVLDLKSRSK